MYDIYTATDVVDMFSTPTEGQCPYQFHGKISDKFMMCISGHAGSQTTWSASRSRGGFELGDFVRNTCTVIEIMIGLTLVLCGEEWQKYT